MSWSMQLELITDQAKPHLAAAVMPGTMSGGVAGVARRRLGVIGAAVAGLMRVASSAR